MKKYYQKKNFVKLTLIPGIVAFPENVPLISTHDNCKKAAEWFTANLPEIQARFGGTYNTFRAIIGGHNPDSRKGRTLLKDLIRLETITADGTVQGDLSDSDKDIVNSIVQDAQNRLDQLGFRLKPIIQVKKIEI
jgi:hypothetical protein